MAFMTKWCRALLSWHMPNSKLRRNPDLYALFQVDIFHCICGDYEVHLRHIILTISHFTTREIPDQLVCFPYGSKAVKRNLHPGIFSRNKSLKMRQLYHKFYKYFKQSHHTGDKLSQGVYIESYIHTHLRWITNSTFPRTSATCGPNGGCDMRWNVSHNSPLLFHKVNEFRSYRSYSFFSSQQTRAESMHHILIVYEQRYHLET